MRAIFGEIRLIDGSTGALANFEYDKDKEIDPMEFCERFLLPAYLAAKQRLEAHRTREGLK